MEIPSLHSSSEEVETQRFNSLEEAKKYLIETAGIDPERLSCNSSGEYLMLDDDPSFSLTYRSNGSIRFTAPVLKKIKDKSIFKPVVCLRPKKKPDSAVPPELKGPNVVGVVIEVMGGLVLKSEDGKIYHFSDKAVEQLKFIYRNQYEKLFEGGTRKGGDKPMRPKILVAISEVRRSVVKVL